MLQIVWSGICVAGLLLACGCQGGAAAQGNGGGGADAQCVTGGDGGACLESCTSGSCSAGSFCVASTATCGGGPFGPAGFCAKDGSDNPDRYSGVDLTPYDTACDAANPCPSPYECTVPCAGHETASMVCLLPCRGGDCPNGYFCNGAYVSSDQGAIGYCVPNV